MALSGVVAHYVSGLEADIPQHEYFVDPAKDRVVLKLFVREEVSCPYCEGRGGPCRECGNMAGEKTSGG